MQYTFTAQDLGLKEPKTIMLVIEASTVSEGQGACEWLLNPNTLRSASKCSAIGGKFLTGFL